mgnify:CR=1 FL=1
MVLSARELIDALKHEVRILSHLVSKVTPEMLDYRPTPKQRSMIELLRYLAMMGPTMTRFSLAKPGEDMGAVWGALVKEVEGMNLEQIAARIAGQEAEYEALLGPLTDADYQATFQGFSGPSKRGVYLVTSVLGGHAAYRTQLFSYLKACGREELPTANLWRGVDAQPKP